MIIYDYLGESLTHQKIVPGNTATGLSADCIKYTRRKLNFDAGTDELTVGSWIVGATSGAVGKVLSLTVTSGTWATDDVVGYVIIDSWNGTVWQDNEKIKQAADATCADVNEPIFTAGHLLNIDYPNKGNMAKAIMVSVSTQTALVNWFNGPGLPDQTALIGQPMVANSSIVISSINDIKNFKVIDFTSGSASTVQVTFYF